jgi:integrase
MAQLIHRLNTFKIQRMKMRGYYCDGLGLYLRVSPTGGKSWVFRFRLAGVSREMGLGSYPLHTLAQARESARHAKQQLAQGVDPINQRAQAQPQRTRVKDPQRSFEACALQYVETKKHEWRNSKHTEQWGSTLRLYAIESIGKLDVQSITTQHILGVLQPIWISKTETATRVRGRIERILDWATATGLRHGANPAKWRGHLQNLLPAPQKIAAVSHHPSMPYADLPNFYQSLKNQAGVAAQALQLLLLCANRTSEATGAQWSEFDLGTATWMIPGARMKAGKAHAVPLSESVIQMLRLRLADTTISPDACVFHSQGKPLSSMAMAMLLRRMGYTDITVHGFRSSFRTWAAECTQFPREIIELALAHTNPNKVEAAYLRTDYVQKRRDLMAQWAAYLNQNLECGVHNHASTCWPDGAQ